jgi:hypothetical protein
MKYSDTDICSVIETRMDEIIDKINTTDSIFEADPLDSEFKNSRLDIFIKFVLMKISLR